MYERNVNYFDLLFMAAQEYMKSDQSWCNIEQMLQEVLSLIYHGCSTLSFTNNDEIKNKAYELKDTYFNSYEFNPEDENAKVEFITFVLHIFNNTSRDDAIKKSLEKYEEIFGRFINKQINDPNTYIEAVNNKLRINI